MKKLICGVLVFVVMFGLIYLMPSDIEDIEDGSSTYQKANAWATEEFGKDGYDYLGITELGGGKAKVTVYNDGDIIAIHYIEH